MTPAAHLLVQQLAQRGEFMHDPHTTMRLNVQLLRELFPDIVGQWAAQAVQDAADALAQRDQE